MWQGHGAGHGASIILVEIFGMQQYLTHGERGFGRNCDGCGCAVLCSVQNFCESPHEQLFMFSVQLWCTGFK